MLRTKVIDALQIFYNCYFDWLEAGAPDDKPFSRESGLCKNLQSWALNYNDYPPGSTYSICGELVNQFLRSNLDHEYPFGKSEYFEAYAKSKQHLDPNRRAWVEKQVGKKLSIQLTDESWKLKSFLFRD